MGCRKTKNPILKTEELRIQLFVFEAIKLPIASFDRTQLRILFFIHLGHFWGSEDKRLEVSLDSQKLAMRLTKLSLISVCSFLTELENLLITGHQNFLLHV